ncbi:MAG: hypothetical protein JWM80_2024 [Cyanobacteria bacterium RYN_339]|nr:hypothetical protein [Cyanobacteria bacterium RYN_339]
MWQARVYLVLGRALAVMLCWVVLMGLPILFFRGPIGPGDLKLFLGIFYALLLATGTVLARLAGARSLLLMAFPFLLVFTALGLRALLDPAIGGWDKATSLNFFAVYAVLFLSWRLGSAPPTNAALLPGAGEGPRQGE